MKLTYETGTAALIQLIVLGLLNIATTIDSTVNACQKDTDCLGSVMINFIFYVVLVGWFVAVSVLGYAAQQKRSRRLAQVLIAAEGLIALVALFDAKHGSGDVLGQIVSVVDLVLALWVISLAFRLMRAKGGRVVAKQRSRQRHTS